MRAGGLRTRSAVLWGRAVCGVWTAGTTAAALTPDFPFPTGDGKLVLSWLTRQHDDGLLEKGGEKPSFSYCGEGENECDHIAALNWDVSSWCF